MHGACYMDENGYNTIPSRTHNPIKNTLELEIESWEFISRPPHILLRLVCPFVLTQAWRGTPTAVSLWPDPFPTHFSLMFSAAFPSCSYFPFSFSEAPPRLSPTWFPSSFDTLSSCICPLLCSLPVFPCHPPISQVLCMLCGPPVGFCDTALLCLDGTSQSETGAADCVYRHAVFFFTHIYKVL